MTDFGKVETYYGKFDEWNRTFTSEGSLEFLITLDIIKKYTRRGDRVLDLGGGPGRYTLELALSGRIMSLGDISPELVSQAEEKTVGTENVASLDVVNALDLSLYGEGAFDAVLCLGPFYHLTGEGEIEKALGEISRILRPEGLLIAAFIPLLSGTAGIMERSVYAPKHVDRKNLLETFRTGCFHNNSPGGFQEGRYLSSDRMERLMGEGGFEKILLRSVRGLGYRLEKGILAKQEDDPALYETIMGIIEETAGERDIVNTCGHALYIGKKKGETGK